MDMDIHLHMYMDMGMVVVRAKGAVILPVHRVGTIHPYATLPLLLLL